MTDLNRSQAVLVAARKLLTPRERWGQGHYFADRDENGQPQRFCLVGALFHTQGLTPRLDLTQGLTPRLDLGNGPMKVAHDRLQTFLRESGSHYQFPTHWNDDPGRTHEEVLRLLDAVIAEEAK